MKKTLYMEIADKIAAYIKENSLQPGDRLPAYRELSTLFGVSSNTVGSALERLHYKGIVDIRSQSGVFVMEEAWKAMHPDTFNWNTYLKRTSKTPIGSLKRFLDSRTSKDSPKMRYILTSAGLSPDYGWYPLQEKLLCKALNNLSSDEMSLPSNEELSKYHAAIARHMEYYGLYVSTDSILLGRSARQSLVDIIITFFSSGSVCYHTSPSMLDFSAIFDTIGITRIPIPTSGKTGIDLEFLAAKVRQNTSARSFLIINPELDISGLSIDMPTRRDIYNFCVTNDIIIIEPDEYRNYRSASLPPIKSLDNRGIVFYIGDFYHIFNSSTDVSWIVATPELIERLNYVRISMRDGCEMLPCRMVYEMLNTEEFRSYLIALQVGMRAREKELNSLLDEYLGDIATWDRDSQVFFWVKFNAPIDAVKITNNGEGLTVSDFTLHFHAEKNSLLISIVGIKQADMRDAIKMLSYIARKSVII